MTGLPLTLSLFTLALVPAFQADQPIPACPAFDAALGPGGVPPAPDPAPGTDGPWLDCYAACVDAQWPRCVEQCGGHDPTTNPCLAICYDAIALGCAIGCSKWGVLPQTVAETAP